MGGLYVLTTGLTLLYKSFVFYRYSITTTGKIVGTEYVDSGNRLRGYAAIVEFKVGDKKKKSDRKIRFTGTELKKEHKIGAEVFIRFIPQAPEIAKVNSLNEICVEPFSAIIVGGVFLIVGLFFLS